MNPEDLRQKLEGRAKYDKAIKQLVTLNCPGDHKPVQHRDGRAPWCPDCGCTEDGKKVGRIR